MEGKTMRGGVLKFRRWIGLGLLLSAALAQQLAGRNDAWPRWSAHGYFAGGSSVSENNAGFKGGGGGVEAFVWKRATVGADISILRDSYYTAVGTFGHAGAQAGYHFAGRERSRGADPFVLFGVGAYFPDESKPALHGGAGFTYWFKPRIGARFEFRVGARPYGDNVDGVARIGVAFR